MFIPYMILFTYTYSFVAKINFSSIQNLAPTWYNLARKYADDPDVKISMLDCTQAKTIWYQCPKRCYFA